MSHTTYTKPVYKVHPAIGVARLGNSPNEFYLAPETTGGLPTDCDKNGNPLLENGKEKPVGSFKDENGCIKRQAARFRIYVYDEENPDGRELKIGDNVFGKGTQGKLVDIQWTVYLANKKAVWYQFMQSQGEHGYAPDHPLRNADITQEHLREQLIIDPGPGTVSGLPAHGPQSLRLGRDNPNYATMFPPPLQPHNIDMLGDLKTTVSPDNNIHLLVLGGFGHSGSMKSGFGEPHIETYANNDGWFDDTSDGPVSATLIYYDADDDKVAKYAVDETGWAVVGYPRFAPELIDMITIDDLTYDLFVRQFGYNPALYGNGKFDSTTPIDYKDPKALTDWRKSPNKYYNPNYYPYFYRDIWPILQRPYYMQYVTNLLGISHDAHEINSGGDFYIGWMSVPPKKDPEHPNQPPTDPLRSRRTFVYSMLRLPGEENQYANQHNAPGPGTYGRELMPLLAGDNPINNVLPSKFLRLTDTQLFMMKQWAEGKFINEKDQGIEAPPLTPNDLDRGVLGNVLGGAFNPGAELCWIIRNPAIFATPYRINTDSNYTRLFVSGGSFINMPSLSQQGNLSTGMQPGDLTKYSALPWQSDFNECSSQVIDITYELWNKLYPDSTGDQVLAGMQKDTTVLWWPVHRPMQVYQQIPSAPDPVTHEVSYKYQQVDWSRGIPQTKIGDAKMVTEWANLGFVTRNTTDDDPSAPLFIESEYTGNAD